MSNLKGSVFSGTDAQTFFNFTENSESPVGEAGGTHSHMSPEEHYRRMMSALSEPGSYEEQQQRLYQLASSMGLHGHGQSLHFKAGLKFSFYCHDFKYKILFGAT